MTPEQVIERLRGESRAQVSKETGLKPRYLKNLTDGDIENPGSKQMDTLRDYFAKKDQRTRKGARTQ